MTNLFFPDVNVWFSLAVADHPQHRAALAWWNEGIEAAGFSRLTQIGLLRLLTTASAMGGSPLTNKKAWAVYDALASDSRVRMFAEIAGMEEQFRLLSAIAQPAPKVWVDAYLAAYASANGATLVTFDQAFTKYAHDCRIVVLH